MIKFLRSPNSQYGAFMVCLGTLLLFFDVLRSAGTERFIGLGASGTFIAIGIGLLTGKIQSKQQ